LLYLSIFKTEILKEIQIGGWQLVRRSGENETQFKFHRTVKVDAGQLVTIWSSDSGATHEPPSNIVMKGQRFFVGDNMSTHLVNSEGEVRIDAEPS
jgi:lamin B